MPPGCRVCGSSSAPYVSCRSNRDGHISPPERKMLGDVADGQQTAILPAERAEPSDVPAQADMIRDKPGHAAADVIGPQIVGSVLRDWMICHDSLDVDVHQPCASDNVRPE